MYEGAIFDCLQAACIDLLPPGRPEVLDVLVRPDIFLGGLLPAGCLPWCLASGPTGQGWAESAPLPCNVRQFRPCADPPGVAIDQTSPDQRACAARAGPVASRPAGPGGCRTARSELPLLVCPDRPAVCRTVRCAVRSSVSAAAV